ncbi:T-lymphocyte surface antigen Ly-9-like isoform X2 [Hyperolius riggenbachi]|uniref:T-lymphocyte surface antigen Ly-9-like isoform X2 n=1 Tax=Hyperolius riggenbachi TaxID=752182 RepID=UPI0035A3657F
MENSGVRCDSCLENRTVISTEGGNITLQINESDFISIEWFRNPTPRIIATTFPDRGIDSRISPQRPRLDSMPDGSLFIKSLQLDDQGCYEANIRWKNDYLPDLVTFYDLRIYRQLSSNNITTTVNVTKKDPCEIFITCSADDKRDMNAKIRANQTFAEVRVCESKIGGQLATDDIRTTVNVTKKDPCEMFITCSVEDKRDINIIWSSINSSNINITQNVLYVPSTDVNYTFTCTVSNPASHAITSVLPWEYCETGVRCDSCLENKTVFSTEGGNITLQINESDFISIEWFRNPTQIFIATTFPDRGIDSRFTPQRPRLDSIPDGSLIIKSLQLDDQGCYRANIRWNKDLEDLNRFYDLRTYRKLATNNITTTSNVTQKDPCEMFITCSVDDKRDINIIWSSINSSNISVTQNVLYVPSTDVNDTFVCNVSNPASHAITSVLPWEYCETGHSDPDNRHHVLPYIILPFVAVVGVVVFDFLWWRRRRRESISSTIPAQDLQVGSQTVENSYTQRRGQEEPLTTVYAAVENNQFQMETTRQKCYNRGGDNAGTAEGPYSEVQLPQGEVCEEKGEKKIPETTYATVQNPKGEVCEENGEKKNPETTYATVQNPKVEVSQQNGAMKNAETTYAKVQYPKNNQKAERKNQEKSMYATVQDPKASAGAATNSKDIPPSLYETVKFILKLYLKEELP